MLKNGTIKIDIIEEHLCMYPNISDKLGDHLCRKSVFMENLVSDRLSSLREDGSGSDLPGLVCPDGEVQVHGG